VYGTADTAGHTIHTHVMYKIN